MIIGLMFFVLAIGVVDAFMTYFRVLRKNQLGHSVFLSHIRGVVFSFLKFLLYFVAAAILLYFENG